jgi:hypothetical protein
MMKHILMLWVANFGAYGKKKVCGPEMVADKENVSFPGNLKYTVN